MEQGVFAGLALDAKALAEVTLAVEAAVVTSFVQDDSRSVIKRVGRITQNDMRQRGQICINIFRVLRGDMKWSRQKCIDFLPAYLRKQLDGEDWEPEARTVWAADPKI